MPLTPDQVKEIQANQSDYGCGADDCHACYPIQYLCEECNATFPSPIRYNPRDQREEYRCPECDWINNENTQAILSNSP